MEYDIYTLYTVFVIIFFLLIVNSIFSSVSCHVRLTQQDTSKGLDTSEFDLS